MTLNFIKTLHTISTIYSLPKGQERFQKYMSLLKGNSQNDLELPIGGYNPMANQQVHDLIENLLTDKIEESLEANLKSLITNNSLSQIDYSLNVALNITDDLGGMWSQKETTDFNNRFKNQALLKRNFSIITAFSSENINLELLTTRLHSSVARAAYQIENGFPISLHDHFQQESWVQNFTKNSHPVSKVPNEKQFLIQFGDSDKYEHIFYFFYGQKVCEKLGYPTFP